MSTDYEAWNPPPPEPPAPRLRNAARGPVQRDWRRAALANNAYRDVQYTNINTQVVVMSVQRDIPSERHRYSTQMITVASGAIAVTVGNAAAVLVEEGESVMIPAGAKHRVDNITRNGAPAKLWTVYSPPVHEPDAYEKDEE